MKIGIDISSLQGAHRFRGIGYVAANFIKNIPSTASNDFVFYTDSSAELSYDTVLKELDLDNIKYEIREMKPQPGKSRTLPGKLKYISKAYAKIIELLSYLIGNFRIKDVRDLDAFIQLDQSIALPRLKFGSSLYFVAYDVIPYVMEADYLWGYTRSRQKGLSRKASIKTYLRRSLYIHLLRINTFRADKIFAISQVTKRDYEKYVRVTPKKIEVVSLGLSTLPHESNPETSVNRYVETSWGYLPKKDSLSGKKFILFVGGADHRRKLDDLVTAFNHLRAQKHDIKLVLSGDSMQGPRNIATHAIQKALARSSYIDDIYFVGFTDDNTRDWLYKHATAFVFPSLYEGFGLPVLEAMSYETPVICYKNDAIKEVALDSPFYAEDALDIKNQVLNILTMPQKQLKQRTSTGLAQAKKYDWKTTSAKIIKDVTSG